MERVQHEAQVHSHLSAFARARFDLGNGPVIRAALLTLAPDEHVLVIVMHHIVSDGWAFTIFIEEATTLYEAISAGQPSPLMPLPIQYADFAAWQRSWLKDDALNIELGYWIEHLNGAPLFIDLPTDRPRPAVPTYPGDKRHLALSAEQSNTIKQFTSGNDSTLFIALHAVLKILLAKWSGQTDLVVGTVIAGRNHAETERLIGCFMNFLALRNRVSSSMHIKDFLQDVKRTVLDGFAHQECPFELLVKQLNPQRSLTQNPLFNVALLVNNFETPRVTQSELRAELLNSGALSAPLDLRFVAIEAPHGLMLSCEYDTELFNAETIDLLLTAYRDLLLEIAAEPEKRVDALVLPEALVEQARTVRGRDLPLAVAATFTAEPVEASLSFWSERLELPLRAAFAPYNQPFQQLLDPDSLLACNTRGLNVVLLRLEDWLGEEDNSATALEANVRDFGEALAIAAARNPVPHIVAVCPPSPDVLSDHKLETRFQHCEQQLTDVIEGLPNGHFITSEMLQKLYRVDDYYDAQGDELASIPYTPEFFTALGSAVFRTIHLLNRRPYK